MQFNEYSTPKRGTKFKVIGVGRISTEHQNQLSLGDQEAYYRQYLDRELGKGNCELEVIASQGSGQILDRAELLQLCEMVSSGDYEIVVAEDLGRISKRIYAIVFCEDAEDTATRVIAINDHVDTANENWKQASIFASFKNESFCKDTSARITRSLRNRFLQGQIFQCEIYGYIKPHSKASDSEVSKDPDAIPIYGEWFTRLESGQNYRMVADWLNDSGILPGKYARLTRWDGRMVQRVTFNSILKGERVRNKRVAVRVNKTGRSKTQKAPEGHQLSRMVPHLAFIEPERYDRVIRLLKKRNAKYKRSESVVNDPRAGIPKRQTRWPGQHLRCGVCGRLFVFGGHGKKERMMCTGARDHKCWNAMTVSGPEVAAAVAERLRELVCDLPDFDSIWVTEYKAQRKSHLGEQDSRLKTLRKKLEAENRKLGKFLDALAEAESSNAIVERIRQCEDNVADLKDGISTLESEHQNSPALPSLEEIQGVAEEAFTEIAVESIDFSRLVRKLLDDFFVLPYRLADGGAVQPRVTFQVSLGRLLNSNLDLPITQRYCQVDLMKQPKRLRYLNDVVKLEGEGMKHKDIAEKLGIFKSEVGYALKLHRLMTELGIDEPWIPMRSSQQVYECFKRVRNPRFKFEPLPGFETTRHPAE